MLKINDLSRLDPWPVRAADRLLAWFVLGGWRAAARRWSPAMLVAISFILGNLALAAVLTAGRELGRRSRQVEMDAAERRVREAADGADGARAWRDYYRYHLAAVNRHYVLIPQGVGGERGPIRAAMLDAQTEADRGAARPPPTP